jgi:hypothetical protein
MQPGALTPLRRVPAPYVAVGAVASLYAWAVYVSTFRYPGSIGINYNVPGTDFMVFHTAAGLALHGDLGALYDPDSFTDLLNKLFNGTLSKALDFRPWVYPPTFLLILLPFGVLGFWASYLFFQAVTAAGLLAALRAAGSRGLQWAAVCSPAASCVAVSGQTSFLVAGLLAAGAALLGRRPWLAGAAFGLLSFKPQFFLMVPVALVAAGAWRALIAASATAAGMAAVSVAWLGPGVWADWLATMVNNASASGADPRWFETGRLSGESVYACAYALGAAPGVASAAQAAAILLAAAATWHAFRQPIDGGRAPAVLLTAALLAAPHSGNYDLLLPVAATVLWSGRGTGPGDSLLLLVVWLEPVFGVPVLNLAPRFTPLLNLALIGRILWTGPR